MTVRAPPVAPTVAPMGAPVVMPMGQPGRAERPGSVPVPTDRASARPTAFNGALALSDTQPRHGVSDADTTRALLTRLLIDQLALALGFDPKRIEVHVDSGAESRISARGAQALQEGSSIYLHPQRYDPRTRAGRFLLAHEATHLAQRGSSHGGELPAAEREADRIGLAFATNRPLSRPLIALPAHIQAAFEGPSLDGSAFTDLVVENHRDELERMRGSLSYGVLDWAITDGDINDVLRILEPWPFPTQVEMVAALGDPFRGRIADNISPIHFSRYRTSILATYDALPGRHANALRDDPFKGMDWAGLASQEHAALRRVIENFRETAKGQSWYDGLSPKTFAHVQDVRSRDPLVAELDSRKAAFEQETNRRRLRQAAKETVSDELSAGALFVDKARKKLSYGPRDWAITDADAVSLLDDIAMFADQPLELQGVVDALENEGLLDRWVDNIPARTLYTDVVYTTEGGAINRRSVYLRVLMLRAPWRNSKKAEELLSTGLLDWAVTDADAIIAAQLVKSLPEHVRAGFYAYDKGALAATLESERSLSVRKGLAANPYTGGQDGSDLRAIKAQLLDDATWHLTGSQAGLQAGVSRLRQLILMARAADEAHWVFEQSRSRYQTDAIFAGQYMDDTFFSRIIDPFKLYVPTGFHTPEGAAYPARETYVPETLGGHAFGTNNGFYQYFIRGLAFLGASLFRKGSRLQIFRESIGGEGMNFADIAAMTGGSLMGAEFVDIDKTKGAQRAALLDNSVRWDLDHGIIEMRAARLDINAINYPMANLKAQTSGVRVEGLHLHMEYPDKQAAGNITVLRLRIDRLEIDDFMLIKPGSMLGIEQISLTDLHVDMQPNQNQDPMTAPDESIAAGAVLLTPMFNILKISKTIDALAKGLLEPSTPLNLTVSASGLKLQGVTTSSGQYVDRIGLDELTIRTRASRGKQQYRAWLQSERTRLDREVERVQGAGADAPVPAPRHWVQFETESSLRRQKLSVEKELQTLNDAEATLETLEAKQKTETLSEAERHKRARLQSYLAGIEEGGLALDIGHVSASGFAGRLTMGDVSLDDVRGYGHSAGAVLGMLTESSTLNRMLRGPEYRGTLAGVETEGDPMAFATLGKVELDAVNIKGAIPTLEEAKKDRNDALNAFNKAPYDPRLLDELNRQRSRVAMTRDYWRVITQTDISATDRESFNRARTWLLNDNTMHVGHFLAKDTTLELTHDSTGSTSIGLESRELEARDIDAKGIHLNTLNGTNVRFGVQGAGGLATLLAVGGKDGPRSVGAYISADQLRLAGLSHKASGAEVQQLVFDALKAQGGVRNGRSTLGLAAAKIEAMGVNWALSAQVLQYQRNKLMQIAPVQRTKAEAAQLADIISLLEILETTTEQLREVEARLSDQTLGKSERDQLMQDKADIDEMLRFWQQKVALRKLTINDLNIDITGLGDVLASDYRFDRDLQSGITVAGAGPNRQIASGVTAEGAWTRLSTGSTMALPNDRGTLVTGGGQTSVEQLSTGPMRGSVTYALDHISLSDFQIDALALTDFRYYSGNTGIWGHGTTRFRNISISARIDTPLVARQSKDEPETGIDPATDDRRMSNVHITSLKIDEIAADHLEYRNLSSGLRLTLTSGSLLGIHATGVDIDFGKTDNDAMLIRGGSAGFSRAQGLHAKASTASGLALANVLNTQALTANFATDGRITADLAEISATSHLTKGELDARFNAQSLSLHIELLPGTKGYANATQKFRLSGDSLGVEGAKGPVPAAGEVDTRTTFGGSASAFDTGEITITPDGTVTAPAISLPIISIDHLHADLGKAVVDVEAGNTVHLLDTTADVTALPNRTPEAKRTPDELPFESIMVNGFRIGTVAMTGMKIRVKGEDGDILVTLPSTRPSLLHELTLGNADGSTGGFLIKPNEAWAMFGKFNVLDTDLRGVGADLGAAVIETLDAKVANFNIGFFGTKDTVIAFDTLTATNIKGSLLADFAPGDPAATGGATSPLMRKLRTAGFDVSFINPGSEHKITAQGFRMDKSGTTLQALEVAGLVYSDAAKGIDIAIHKATLPAAQDGTPAFSRTPDGKLTIPNIVINEADFRVDDVLKLGGPEKAGAAAKGALSYGPDLKLLDQLNGTVRFTVELFLNGAIAGTAAYAAGPYNIVVRIVNGQIDFEQVEDESTGYLADAAVGLTYVRPGTLDMDHDPPRIRPPQLQLEITGADPIWWDLTATEGTLAETGWVKLTTFIRQPPGMKASDEPTKTALISNLFFGNVDIHLELPGQSEIKLGNAGSLMLGGGGPNDAGFAIDITSAEVPAISTTVSSLHASVASMNLKLASGTLKTGAILISGSNVAELSFERQGVGPVYTDDDGRQTQNRLPVPKTLSGKLVNATMKDLEYTPIPTATRKAK